MQGLAHIMKSAEPARVQVLVSRPAVKAFDMAVLHRAPLAGQCTSPTFWSTNQASIRREVNSRPLSEPAALH